MGIIIKITEEEISNRPNNMDLGQFVRQRYNDIIKTEDELYDKCNVCGKKTPYLKTDHIDYRINYIEGMGQGCFQPIACEKNEK